MKGRKTCTRVAGRARLRHGALAAAVAAVVGNAAPALAFEIPSDNPDLTVRWDNTLRYNAGVRAQSQDSAILKNPNYDDGDRNFSNGTMTANRLDILSEFDFVWRRKYGFRVSAAGWYDGAASNLANDSPATSNHLGENGLPMVGLSPYTQRYARGMSGEVLDAFAFANVDLGTMPFSVKVGQHTVYWGESLLLGGALHGVDYAQNSLDIWKGLQVPGSEAKELFRPRQGITAQLQAMPDLSIAAQWFWNWQAVRYPESGSYLTVNDALNFGGQSLIVGPNPFAAAIPGAPAYLRAWNLNPIDPSMTNGSTMGDWGLAARWSPAWLDGTVGLYYRNATDIQPQLILTPGMVPLSAQLTPAACGAIGGQVAFKAVCMINKDATTQADLASKGKYGTYQTAYGNNIHILGLSLSKNIAGVSVGAELSYRQNMPLLSDPVTVLPAPLAALTPGAISVGTIPSTGTPGALGDTMHGLLNGIWSVPKTPLWDTATLQGELSWMTWLSVTQNEAVFKGRSNYTGIDKPDKNYFGLGLNFTPTWYQVFPGIDMYAPLTWSQGISGNAAVTSGGNDGTGNWSAGVAMDIQQKYRVDLKYTGYYGSYSTLPNGAMNVPNGVSAALSDRGFVSLTFKTTF